MSTQPITMKKGYTVTIEDPYTYSKCRNCMAEDLVWATTAKGKKMPIQYSKQESGWVSHFDTCAKKGASKQEEIEKKAETAVSEILANLIERKRTGSNNFDETKQEWKMIIIESFK